jgi:uncharacterized protein with HEPN domain
MKGPLSDRLRVQHILDAIGEVEAYIAGVTEEKFLESSEKRFATIKQIEIIGEACTKIAPEIKQAHTEIPWHQIIGFRHISIHEYHNVSMHVVWDIATNNLPVLKMQMQVLSGEIS